MPGRPRHRIFDRAVNQSLVAQVRSPADSHQHPSPQSSHSGHGIIRGVALNIAEPHECQPPGSGFTRLDCPPVDRLRERLSNVGALLLCTEVVHRFVTGRLARETR